MPDPDRRIRLSPDLQHRLKRIRAKAKVTLADAADAIGVSTSCMGAYEHGHYRMRVRHLEIVLRLCNFPIEGFLPPQDEPWRSMTAYRLDPIPDSTSRFVGSDGAAVTLSPNRAQALDELALLIQNLRPKDIEIVIETARDLKELREQEG